MPKSFKNVMETSLKTSKPILAFNIQNIPADAVLISHLIMVAFLMIIFPYSKLLHAPGLFFSPSRNQVDNAREKRHVAKWAEKLEKN